MDHDLDNVVNRDAFVHGDGAIAADGTNEMPPTLAFSLVRKSHDIDV